MPSGMTLIFAFVLQYFRTSFLVVSEAVKIKSAFLIALFKRSLWMTTERFMWNSGNKIGVDASGTAWTENWTVHRPENSRRHQKGKGIRHLRPVAETGRVLCGNRLPVRTKSAQCTKGKNGKNRNSENEKI